MGKRNKNRLRLQVTNPSNGTSSGVWNIWLGKEGFDIYLAPRNLAGDFKLSVHRDGYNQIGFYAGVRKRLRAGDGHYFSRWRREVSNNPIAKMGLTPLAQIWFSASEFESEHGVEESSKPVSQIPMPRGSKALVVVIAVTEESFDQEVFKFEGVLGGEVKSFVRDDGTEVKVFWLAYSNEPLGWLSGVDEHRYGAPWDPPIENAKASAFGFSFARANGVPVFSEFLASKHRRPSVLPNMPDFNGIVLPWELAPEPYRSLDAFCGVLHCIGSAAFLYVDTRSRCEHHHLVEDSNKLIAAFRAGDWNRNWEKRGPDEGITTILTPATAEQKGLLGGRFIKPRFRG